MKLSTKWLLWFAGIGLYVMFLGGIFYFNLFKWTFDERLKESMLDMVRDYAPTLIKGLARSQSAITMDELDVVDRFSKDERVADLLYLNKYGDVRWFKDPTKIAQSFDQFSKENSLPSDAIQQSWVSKAPSIRTVANLPLYDIAIPLALRGDILGIVDLQVSRQGVNEVIGEAMQKYAVGSLGVLLLLGIPLYFFLNHFIVNPLLDLRDAVDSLSFKNLELKFAPRPDEIGEVADSFQRFVAKAKSELENAAAKKREHGAAEVRWWQSILTVTIPKGFGAMVVDEDNGVLYTNLPVPGGAEAPERLHLLDVIDSQQQDVLRLVGMAMDRPNQMVEADTTYRAEPCHVRAVHVDEGGDVRRTVIIFEIRSVGARLG